LRLLAADRKDGPPCPPAQDGAGAAASELPGFEILDVGRDRWLSVGSTVGVARLFTHRDGRPVPVPAGIVEQLIVHSEDDLARLDSGLVKGQRVRILTGPFADFVGTLARLDAAGRVQVLLEMMKGRAAAVRGLSYRRILVMERVRRQRLELAV
jgi:hypothetical protein